jgi:hypothetical protein
VVADSASSFYDTKINKKNILLHKFLGKWNPKGYFSKTFFCDDNCLSPTPDDHLVREDGYLSLIVITDHIAIIITNKKIVMKANDKT